jgi:hypothetical protein
MTFKIRYPKHRKQKICNCVCFKLKIFSTGRETINIVKKKPNELEKIFSKYSFNKRLISRTYKEHYEFNNNNSKNKQANEKLK